MGSSKLQKALVNPTGKTFKSRSEVQTTSWIHASTPGMALVILFLMVSMFVLSYIAVEMAKACTFESRFSSI